MSKRSRERQLAKLAARRQAERDAVRRRRERILRSLGIVVAMVLVASVGLFLINRKGTTTASPSPTVKPSGSPSASPSDLPVACGGSVPKTAGEGKPTIPQAPPMLIDPSKTYTATMQTSCGRIVIQLDAVHAPIGVNSFVFLVKKAFYNGLTFHRIVKDFVIQGGDPKGDGSGGPGYQFATETSPKVTFDSAGLLAYANSGPDTNGSQFFITLAPTPQLNPSTNQSFTIFGKVIKGLDVVKKIGAIPGTPNPGIPGENSVPTQTVYIESVKIAVGP
jgi:cyclophilin family peptidyl-prolyl cis-trans isomerase